MRSNNYARTLRFFHRHGRLDTCRGALSFKIILLAFNFLPRQVPTASPDIKECVARAFLSTKLSQTLIQIGTDRRERELALHIMAIFSLLCRTVVRFIGRKDVASSVLNALGM